MEALPALARAHRYGDVRGTDTSALREVAETLVVRICAGLTRAVTGLDAEAARRDAAADRRVHHAVGLLELPADGSRPTRRRPRPTGARLVRHPGRAARTAPTCTAELARPGGPAAARRRVGSTTVRSGCTARCRTAPRAGDKAAWVDGFFADGALLLIHDPELRGLLDAWVGGLDRRRVHRRAAPGPAHVRHLQPARAPTDRRTPGRRPQRSADRRRSRPSYDLELRRPRRWPWSTGSSGRVGDRIRSDR